MEPNNGTHDLMAFSKALDDLCDALTEMALLLKDDLADTQSLERNDMMIQVERNLSRNKEGRNDARIGGGDVGEREDERSLEKKVVSAPARSELVRYLIDKGLSERRSLGIIDMSASA